MSDDAFPFPASRRRKGDPRRPRTEPARQLAIVTLVTLTLLAAPGASAAADQGWKLRVDFAFVDPGGNVGSVDVGDGITSVELDAGAGAGVRGEILFSPRLGLDIGVLGSASVDIDTVVGGNGVDTSVDVSTFAPFTFGLFVHLTPEARPDLYIGPIVA